MATKMTTTVRIDLDLELATPNDAGLLRILAEQIANGAAEHVDVASARWTKISPAEADFDWADTGGPT